MTTNSAPVSLKVKWYDLNEQVDMTSVTATSNPTAACVSLNKDLENFSGRSRIY